MTRPTPSTRRLAAVAAVAVLAASACDDADENGAARTLFEDVGPAETATSTASETTAETLAPSTTDVSVDDRRAPDDTVAVAPVAMRAPQVHAAAATQQTIAQTEIHAARLVETVDRASGDPTADEVVHEWIVALTALEQVLDADAIRAIGDDPVLEEIAAPIDDLDESVVRVLDLLDPPTGEPDILGALVEARGAVERWEAAVPGIEESWDDAVARWTAEWEQAVDDWEQAWADAVAEWEQAWADAVAEWEAEWELAVAEWERAWADAVAEWEQAWADAVAEWEAEWERAVEEWQREAEEQRRQRQDQPQP